MKLEVKQNTKDLVLAAHPYAVAKLIQNGAQIIDSSNEDILATVLVESMHFQDPVAFAWQEALKKMQCPEIAPIKEAKMKLTAHEIRNGNLVVSLTNDAYEYNNEFFTIEVTQMDGSECIENDADMSGLPVLSNKTEIDLFLSAAMEYAIANCGDELEPVVRRLSHPAAQAGLNAIAKVETETFVDMPRG